MNEVDPGRQVTLADIRDILEADVLSGLDLLARPVSQADATDLMSQVLAFCLPGTVLLTALVNIQVINTAEVAGLAGVIFVRALRPPDPVIARAESLSIPLLITTRSLYHACGVLYGLGLPGLTRR